MAPTKPFTRDKTEDVFGSRHVERLLEANRERLALRFAQCAPHEIARLGIVGAGVMGSAIAAAAVANGIDVVIADNAEAAVAAAEESVRRQVETDYPGTETRGNVVATGQLEDVVDCDAVVESILENPLVKEPLLRDLDRRMPPATLLATNTSTLPIGRLGRGLAGCERLCGTHFFLPLARRPVVEVILSDATSSETAAAAVRLATALGRHALPAPDSTGFVVNRMMMPYVGEAMQLLTEGVEPGAIERAAVEFGMPNGPLSLLDEVGLDTALDCGWVVAGAYEDRVVVSPLLVAMVKAKRLGIKTGSGFFRYGIGGDGVLEQQADPDAAALVARWSKPAPSVSAERIAARLFLPMLNEGVRLMEENESCLPDHIDLGVVLGLGMAPERGGLLFWCDQIGADRVLDIAEPLAALGARMEPPELLRRMAQVGSTFHGSSRPPGDVC